MIVGDSADWDGFFQQNLIPVVLALVISAWDSMEKPGQTAHEDDISVKLYAALINGKDRNRHMFLIRYEDVEIDTDLAKETGRKDIVFFPANDEDIYFCLEAKRLNYKISRTFLSQMLFMAHLQLATLFRDEQFLWQKDHQHFDHLLLLLRLEGKCSLLSITAILKALEYHPKAVGYLSQFFHSAGQALPSTLVMPSQTWVLYLSDEIFALHAPLLVTIDAASTAIIKIELASERSAETWRAHFEALAAHHFSSLGMASDRGLGLGAGYRAACDMALWVTEYFHAFRDLFEVLHHMERKA